MAARFTPKNIVEDEKKPIRFIPKNRALSRNEISNFGVTEKTSAKQRQVITDALLRRHRADQDIIKGEMKVAEDVSKQVQAGTYPEFKPSSARIPGVITDLPGGFFGLTRKSVRPELKEQEYISQLRKIRKSKSTAEEKDIVSNNWDLF